MVKHDFIEITFANRPLYRNCVEDTPGKLGQRARGYTTTYKISINEAYRPTGAYSFDLNYDMRHLVTKTDYLTISNIKGLDPSKIKVVADRNPDYCIRDEEADASKRTFKIETAELALVDRARATALRNPKSVMIAFSAINLVRALNRCATMEPNVEVKAVHPFRLEHNPRL